MLAQYSNPLLRYAKPLDLVSSIPTLVNLHPAIENLAASPNLPLRPPPAPPSATVAVAPLTPSPA